MQAWKALPASALMLSAMLLFIPCITPAGEYTAVEVGSSGLTLPNRAMQQDKHYVGFEDDLMGRIGTLVADVDCLLARLNALPPELHASPVVDSASDPELGELFVLALSHNPALAAKRSELGMLAARTRQEGARQDPMLGFELRSFPTPFPLLTHNDESGAMISFSQELEGYGKRGLRRTIAQYDEQLSELELKQQELDLLYEITEKYYELMGSKAELRALRANIDLMAVLIELAERKYALGRTPQASVLAAQVELSTMEAMAIELEILSRQQAVALLEMLGYPPDFDIDSLNFDAPYPLPPVIEWDNPSLIAAMLEERPDYQRLEMLLNKQGLELELARRGYHPDYTIMAEYEIGYGTEDTVSAGVEIPLFTNKEERQDARVQEVYAQQAITEGEKEVVENELRARLETLQYELKMHAELVEIYRKVLVPQARLSLDSNIAAYAANMMDFSDLIMSQQSLLAQENALEQNYIHILHTLADLQVISAGAFDPAPYMAQEARLDYSEAAVAPESLQELIEQQSEPRSALPVEAPFVEQLDLPEAIQPEGEGLVPLAIPLQQLAGESQEVSLDAAAQSPASEDGAAGEGLEGSSGPAAAKEADPFYSPFEPVATDDEVPEATESEDEAEDESVEEAEDPGESTDPESAAEATAKEDEVQETSESEGSGNE